LAYKSGWMAALEQAAAVAAAVPVVPLLPGDETLDDETLDDEMI
jgi:hypothetical protein